MVCWLQSGLWTFLSGNLNFCMLLNLSLGFLMVSLVKSQMENARMIDE
jgi:hypothetical protein